MWDSSCLDRFLEMRSAIIQVRAIRDDLNARRRNGEHPENKCYESALYRWQDAIVALAEGLYSRQSVLLVGDAAGPLKVSWLKEGRARRVRISTTAARYQN
jgi:hypothetical protein